MNIVIIIDGSKASIEIAAQIKAALTREQGCRKVTVKSAADFSGSHLLPADCFFVGCARPAPPDFTYIADLFAHINLAGRPCGVFSPSAAGVRYLKRLVKDSEAALYPQPLVAARGADVSAWARGVISQ